MHAEMYRFCEDSIYPCSGLSQNQKAMIPHALFHRDESVRSPNAYKSGQENPSEGCPIIHAERGVLLLDRRPIILRHWTVYLNHFAAKRPLPPLPSLLYGKAKSNSTFPLCVWYSPGLCSLQ